MTSLLITKTTSSPSASATEYNWINVNDGAGWSGTESSRQSVVPHAMTLDRLFIYITAPGVGKSRAFTVMKNGVATSLSVTVSGTNTSGSDTSNSVSLAAGDTISMKSVPSGTPASTTSHWFIRQAATGLAGVLGSDNNTDTGATDYHVAQGYSVGDATRTNVEAPVPASGTLKNLYVKLSAAPGAGTSYAITLWKNGSATTLTTTISGGTDTAGNDTTHNVTVAAGDLIAIEVVPSGTPSAVGMTWGMSFAPDTSGQSFLLQSDPLAPSTTVTNYQTPQGQGGSSWNSNEGNRYYNIGSITLKGMYVALTTAPGTGNSWVILVRQKPVGGSSGDTSVTVTISGTNTTGNITGQTVSFGDGDETALKSTPSGTPASTVVHTGALYLGDADPATPSQQQLLGYLPLMGAGA